jgi:hypothetical protein
MDEGIHQRDKRLYQPKQHTVTENYNNLPLKEQNFPKRTNWKNIASIIVLLIIVLIILYLLFSKPGRETLPFVTSRYKYF